MISRNHDFAFFEYWLSDYAGHRQDMSQATELLTSFDQVLGGLLNTWEDDKGLILLTSDHGNLEDLRTRRHTENPVPALLIGDSKLRQEFIKLLYAANGSQDI
jgi:2,3-bisphosphoglycerate-independent phosphoglycerate mutase